VSSLRVIYAGEPARKKAAEKHADAAVCPRQQGQAKLNMQLLRD